MKSVESSMLRIHVILICVLFMAMELTSQKLEPLKPSPVPFHQAEYLITQREMPRADSTFGVAISDYQKRNLIDSMALAALYRARTKTLINQLDSAHYYYDYCHEILSNRNDTLVLVKAMLPYVRTGIALLEFDLTLADSMGNIALSTIKNQLGECHPLVVNMLNDLGIINYIQHRYTVTDSLVTAARECAFSIYEDKDLRLIPTYNMSGAVSDDRGYITQAIKFYRSAIDLMQYHGMDENYDYARLLHNLANAMLEEGGALDAIELFQKSVAISEKKDDYKNNLNSSYYNIANMFNTIGYYNKALEYLEKVQTKNDRGEGLPDVHFAYELKSNIYATLGNKQESDRNHDLALENVISFYGEESELLGQLLLTRSRTLKKQQRDQEALVKVLSGLEMFEKFGWNIYDNDRGEFFFTAAEINLSLGDTSNAIKLAKKSINDFLNSEARQQLEASYSYSLLTQIFIVRNQIDSAEFYINEALELLYNGEGEYVFLKSYPISDFLPYYLFYDILATKINVLRKRYEATTDTEYLRVALEESRVLEEVLKQTSSTYLEEQDAVERVNLYWPYYESIISTRVETYGQEESKENFKSTLDVLEDTKDVVYKMALREASSSEMLGLSPDLAEQEEKFKSDIKRLDEELYTAELEGKDESAVNIRSQLLTMKNEYDVFKSELAKSNKRYYNAKYATSDLSMDELHNYLKKQQANLINYFIGEQQCLAFVITGDKEHIIELGHPSHINKQIDEAILTLRKVGDLKPLEELAKSIISPIHDVLDEEEIIVIPDGKLHFIPFEALVLKEDEFLVQKFQVQYSHSIAPLLNSLKLREGNGVFGIAPGFDIEIKDWLKVTSPESPQLALIQQPNAVNFVEEIAKTKSGKALLRRDATELKFKSRLDNANILVLATHAEADESHPLYSRISLLPEEQEDGLLHVFEILGLDLKYNLAVLTACETGLGALDRGQGVASLSHAFKYAGCQNILMSLWSIDEKQSVQITEDFLTGVTDGEDMSAALTNAKRHYLDKARGELLHPYYWSGLVLVGQSGQLPAPFNWWRPLTIALAISIALLIIAINRSRRKESE